MCVFAVFDISGDQISLIGFEELDKNGENRKHQ